MVKWQLRILYTALSGQFPSRARPILRISAKVIFCGRSVIAYEISFFFAFSLILACSETIPSPPHKTNDSHKDPRSARQP